MSPSFAITEWSKPVNKRVWAARFKPEIPPVIDFTAGQYCSFKVKDTLRRSFSITTPPNQKDSFEVCIDVTPLGPGSVFIMNLKAGDRVEFMGPIGKFLHNKESPRSRVFIATGTGIAPIRSMIYDALSSVNNYIGNLNRDIYLFWGMRYEEDIFWNDEFIELAKVFPNFHYSLSLSKPTENWKGKKGYVTEHFGDLNDLTAFDYYLCGSRMTIDSVKENLTARGALVAQMYTELFF